MRNVLKLLMFKRNQSKKKEIKDIKKKLESIEKEKPSFWDTISRIYYIFPSKYREMIESEARYAGVRSPEKYASIVFLVNFVMLLGVVIYLFVIIKSWWWLNLILLVMFFLISMINPYLALMLVADSRRKRIEQFLPDFLILTSANIKSGLTIDKALLFASRPEFGELSELTKRTAYEIYGGKDVEDAFFDLASQIKSKIFEKTINLLVQGLRSGGAVAKLLEETANDIRNTETLQKEIKSSVIMYIIFIFFAGVIGAPSLFSISIFLVSSTSTMWGDQSNDLTDLTNEYDVVSFIQFKNTKVDVKAFEYFAVAAIIITTVFAGMLISIIQTGKARNAIKYSPIFMLIAIGIYYALKTGLFKVFSSMLGF
ncbi:MAG: hypothetical protein GXN99_03030 [Candidatus Nanohaloarchaeota archaeon]|nr:hypothetical protein [Candidatus Nanohaloarchaeota archaeon]